MITESMKARERARARRYTLWGWLSAVATMVAGAALVIVLVGGKALPIGPMAVYVAVAAGLAMLCLVSLMLKDRPGAVARAIAEQTPFGDRVQRQRRAQLFAMPTSVLLMGGIATIAVVDIVYYGQALTEDMGWIRAGMLILVAPLAPLALRGNLRQRRSDATLRYLDDEFSVALRGRAWGVGYSVLLTGACVLYGLALVDPRLAMAAAPMTLAIGALTPGLWFAIQDKRADSDD